MPILKNKESIRACRGGRETRTDPAASPSPLHISAIFLFCILCPPPSTCAFASISCYGSASECRSQDHLSKEQLGGAIKRYQFNFETAEATDAGSTLLVVAFP
ncbi:hypothetical protein CC2G_004281 [Coprinopsis cinerea AmutBmut pab1-1]|nr:hypothetical protein CC2G_004281 [Coprinopsis cinerea AmutBmut pab1-1]